MKIDDVAIFRLSGTWEGEDLSPGEVQAHPIDLYDDVDRRPTSGFGRGVQQMSALYVEIKTDEGASGLFGPIQKAQAFVIASELKPFLMGRDPLASAKLHDQMLRLNRHGRSGIFMTGLSPIDCALWDLKGRGWGQPIYRLLGGPTRAAVPAYASMLGNSIEPEDAARTARQYQAKGYQAQKWFFRHGPAHGEEGLARNMAMAEAVRAAVGPQYKLMFDAFMGWDLTYAARMVRALEGVNPTWLEEPIPPERVGELARLRRASQVPIATGEHVYTRWQTKELLVNEAVDFLQNDPDWTGGISELTKIVALASAFEVPVVAHGHSLLAALHVAGAESPTAVPFVEYLVYSQPKKQFFHQPIYAPDEGMMKLPELPGLGLVLDEDKIEGREEVLF